MLFVESCDRNAGRTAFHWKEHEVWRSMSWVDTLDQTARTTKALASLGVGHGTPVAILSETRHEWAGIDLATLALRGITVGVYPTLLPEQVLFQLNHAEVAVCVVENAEQAAKVQSIAEQVPSLKHIVSIEPVEGLQMLSDLAPESSEQHVSWFREQAAAVQPDDVATYIYTSGTTGLPKGAVLTHANFIFVVYGTQDVAGTREGDRGVVFLPMAHSLQRYAGYLGLHKGAEGFYCPSIPELGETLLYARPHVLASVPRMLEKIRAKAIAAAAQKGPVVEALFSWAFSVGMARMTAIERKQPIPFWTRFQYRFAKRIVLSKVADRLGGELRVLGCGGAALDPEVARWFGALEITILEGWGLTETAAPVTVNRETDFRFGTVGKPIPGVEVKIASDGELLVRGAGLFRGYFKNEEATSEAIVDGWFHTGDIGEFDADGFLKITDRKKEIIITAGGKNIAPVSIENRITRNPYVGVAVAIGDGRAYITALLAPDAEAVEELAAQHGWPDEPMSDRVKRPELLQQFEAAVAEANVELARFEQVKKWAALPAAFAVEGGELTPTMKLKRRVVGERYADVIEGLYSQGR